MDLATPAEPPCELERSVLLQTGWRVRNLLIELHGGHAVLRGRATTSYARQLAQRAAQELLPHVRLDNAIVVDHDVEVLIGMPLH